MTEDNEAMIASAAEVKRKPFWAMLGSDVTETMTAEEAIVRGGLDWEVELRPLQVRNSKGNLVKVPGRFASVRTSDDYVFGIVGSHYVPWQNRQAFAFADYLVDAGEARFDTVFTQRGGRVVGLTMKLPEGVLVAGGDPHDLYLLLRTSHDGTRAVGAYLVVIRQKCTNQTTFMTTSARYRWSIQHVSTIEDRLDEARDALKLTTAYADEFKRNAEKLAATQLEIDDFEEVLKHAVPKRPRTPEVIETIVTNLRLSSTIQDDLRRTCWGGLQAVTEYYDWLRDTKSIDARLTTSLEGVGATVRNRVASLLLRRAR